MMKIPFILIVLTVMFASCNDSEIDKSQYKDLWGQGEFAESEGTDLYQVRCFTEQESPLCYYLSYNPSKSVKYAYIHELNSENKIYIVDSLLIHEAGHEDGDPNDFFNRQYDNLFMQNQYLYYYKERGDTKEYKRDQRSERDYFRYELSSQGEIQKQVEDSIYFQMRHSFNSFEKVEYSRSAYFAAYSNGFDLLISRTTSRLENFGHLMEGQNFQPLSMNQPHVKSLNRRAYPKEDKLVDDRDPLYGSMSWSRDNKILYFIKAKGDSAGLYSLNMRSSKLKDLVLDNKVRDPYSFVLEDSTYVAYTTQNRIILHKISETQSDTKLTPQIDYDVTGESDGFWKRGVLYESPNERESIFNPRCISYNNSLRYFFWGAIDDNSDNQSEINLYEYISEDNVRIIDSFGCPIYFNDQDDFVNMADNLIVKDGKLYYYKYGEDLNSRYSNSIDPLSEEYQSRLYYCYDLATNKLLDQVEYSQIQDANNKLTSEFAFSHKNNKVAYNKWNTDLYIFDYGNVDRLQVSKLINSSSYSQDNRDSTMIELNKIGIKFELDLASLTKEGEDIYTLGYLSWDYEGNNLYFCNSYIEQACIWKIDLQKKELTKIVPEHDAVEPFYFEYASKPYILYVEKNKLMVCEPNF